MIPRSYLYVPGSAGDRLRRAGERGADALILDLEDGVAAREKDSARAAVASYLRGLAPGGSETGGPEAGRTETGGAETWVRINGGELGRRDVTAVVMASLTGVCVPKVDGPAELGALDEVLTAVERQAGLAPGSVAVCPLIESAAGLSAAAEIARSPRVRLLQIGEADLTADLGLEPGPAALELLMARSQVVLASRAAGLLAPMAAVSVNFGDLDRFREETLGLRRLGFRGRACIHPAQLPVVRDVFTPSAEELAEARSIVHAYQEVVARGDGAGVDHHGRMLDEAVVRSARAIIAMSR